MVYLAFPIEVVVTDICDRTSEKVHFLFVLLFLNYASINST